MLDTASTADKKRPVKPLQFAAAVALLLVAGLGVWTWFSLRADANLAAMKAALDAERRVASVVIECEATGFLPKPSLKGVAVATIPCVREKLGSQGVPYSFYRPTRDRWAIVSNAQYTGPALAAFPIVPEPYQPRDVPSGSGQLVVGSDGGAYRT